MLNSWVAGTGYGIGNLIRYNGVTYQCIAAHTAVAGVNEPDASPDAGWQDKWLAISVTWGDWMFFRLPSWIQSLDEARGYPLYRFLRIFGHAMNITQQETDVFPLLKDVDNVPAIYLSDYADTLGLLLPHAVDEAAQRRLLATIALLYRRKGTRTSLEFIASRYLGINITITDENFATHRYTVTYDENLIPVADRETFKQELRRILALYEPAGLISSVNQGALGESWLNESGFLNDSFLLNGGE